MGSVKNILILNCGPGLDEVRNEFGIAVEWIQREVDGSKFKCTSMNVYDGEMPSYDDGDAWILTGASESVYDDFDWIVELEQAIKLAIEVEKPIFVGELLDVQSVLEHELKTKILKKVIMYL